MRLQFRSHISTGDVLIDTALRAFDFASLPSGNYLYVGNPGQGGTLAYRLTEGTTASEIDRHSHSPGTGSTISGVTRLVELDGQLQVVFGGTGGAAMSSYAVLSNGTMGVTLSGLPLTTGTGRITDVIHAPGVNDAIYVADETGGRISTYVPDPGGGYMHLSGNDVLLGAGSQLATVEVGSYTYLVGTDPLDNGIVSYRMQASGTLQLVSHMGAAQGLGVSAPTAIETVEAFGASWVILAAAGTHSLSVMRMDASGRFEPVDLIMDTLNTRFGGVTSLATVESGGRVFVLAGGADDGLSLFTLMPDGRLLHLESLEHTLGAGLMNVDALDMVVVGDELQIFVTSGTEGGFSQYTIDLSTLGATLNDSSTNATLFSGGSEDDFIFSGGGYDTLIGGAGDDILSASTDGARMTGGLGKDTFVIANGAAQSEITDFTAGEDRLDISAISMLYDISQVTVTALADGARLDVRGQSIIVRSSTGLPLSASDIWGLNFDWPTRVPILPAMPGIIVQDDDTANLLTGTNLADTLEGNGGNDTILGLQDDDVLSGGLGDDSLQGDDGNDALDGGGNHDTLIGGLGDDTLVGGWGHDSLTGDQGNDSLRGDNGNDTLWGGDGDDEIAGGAGNDTLGGGEQNDTLSGDAGFDHLSGGAGNDKLYGGNNDDTLYGYAGDDTLSGGNHNDLMYGGTGQDYGQGGAGNDSFYGEDGNDLFYGGSGNDRAEGGTGNDELFGEDGNDTLYGHGGSDSLWGNGGDDDLDGGLYSDTVGGGDGNDTVRGNHGNDQLWGAAGNDQLWGGVGNDTAGGGSGSDTLWGEDGDDLVWGGDGNDLQYGGNGNDTVGGFMGNDTLYGNDGHDQVWGNTGDDLMHGNAGNDTLGGYRGNDTLYGGAGNDRLAGGDDADQLWGGTGADLFVFTSQHGVDHIRDFEVNIDHINLRGDLSFGALTLESDGAGGTLVRLPTGWVYVDDVQPWQLDAGDFIFG